MWDSKTFAKWSTNRSQHNCIIFLSTTLLSHNITKLYQNRQLFLECAKGNLDTSKLLLDSNLSDPKVLCVSDHSCLLCNEFKLMTIIREQESVFISLYQIFDLFWLIWICAEHSTSCRMQRGTQTNCWNIIKRSQDRSNSIECSN